ncbi:hypothetical protein LTR53_013961, partial [Teratosphaeriaceae sp. CCFEE 6253]
PLHPAGEQPRASCPQCQERGDHSMKSLYGIRGLNESQMDTAIPPEWMLCPAIKFDGTVPGMEAVRFQYMNVARYAQHVTRYWKSAVRQQLKTEAARLHERKQRRELQREVESLKDRLRKLEQADAKLQKWEARKLLIHHYLGAVHDMSEYAPKPSPTSFGMADYFSEIATLRQQLSQLGYEVPRRSYAFDPAKAGERSDTAAMNDPRPQKRYVAVEPESSSSARKRKLARYEPEQTNLSAPRKSVAREKSRDLMPPPLPKSTVLRRQISPVTGQLRAHQPRSVFGSHQAGGLSPDQAWQMDSVEPGGHAPSRRSLNAQAIPFRPILTNSGADKQVPSSHRVLDPTEPLHDQPQHSIQRRHGRESRSSLHNGLLQRPVDQQNAAPPPAQSMQHEMEHDDTHYDANGERDNWVGPPPRFFSGPNVDRQLPPGDANSGQYGIQSLTQPVTASVASPFFKRGLASISDTQGRPLPNGVVRRPPSSHTRDARVSHWTSSPRHEHVQDFAPLSNPQRLPLITKLRGAAEPQLLYDTVPYRRPDPNQHQRTHDPPQTPRNLQGLFQRPDRPPPSAAYAQSRPQSTAYRGRVSLPPNKHTMLPPTGSQERALSQIRGVRGVSSQGVRPSLYGQGPLYDAPRSLFSSARGRRSVKR